MGGRESLVLPEPDSVVDDLPDLVECCPGAPRFLTGRLVVKSNGL